MSYENRRQQLHEALPEPPISEAPRPSSAPVDIFDARTDKQKQVLDTLQAGVEGILTSEGYQAYLKTMSKFHRYSFANSLLIHVQNPEATHVAGYQKWKQLDRQVRKGEKAIKIFIPFRKKTEDPETGEERWRVTGFGLGSVFDISSTDGEPLPEPPAITESHEVTDVSREVNKRLSRYLIDQGLLLESKDFPGHAHGFWNPTKNQIVIRQNKDVDPLNISKTKTLLHEGAHALANHQNADERQDAEVVAESAAYVAFSHFGVDTANYSFSYVAGWGQDAQRLRKNLGEVQKISNVLISAIEGTEPTEPDNDLD